MVILFNLNKKKMLRQNWPSPWPTWGPLFQAALRPRPWITNRLSDHRLSPHVGRQLKIVLWNTRRHFVSPRHVVKRFAGSNLTVALWRGMRIALSTQSWNVPIYFAPAAAHALNPTPLLVARTRRVAKKSRVLIPHANTTGTHCVWSWSHTHARAQRRK